MRITAVLDALRDIPYFHDGEVRRMVTHSGQILYPSGIISWHVAVVRRWYKAHGCEQGNFIDLEGTIQYYRPSVRDWPFTFSLVRQSGNWHTVRSGIIFEYELLCDDLDRAADHICEERSNLLRFVVEKRHAYCASKVGAVELPTHGNREGITRNYQRRFRGRPLPPRELLSFDWD